MSDSDERNDGEEVKGGEEDDETCSLEECINWNGVNQALCKTHSKKICKDCIRTFHQSCQIFKPEKFEEAYHLLDQIEKQLSDMKEGLRFKPKEFDSQSAKDKIKEFSTIEDDLRSEYLDREDFPDAVKKLNDDLKSSNIYEVLLNSNHEWEEAKHLYGSKLPPRASNESLTLKELQKYFDYHNLGLYVEYEDFTGPDPYTIDQILEWCGDVRLPDFLGFTFYPNENDHYCQPYRKFVQKILPRNMKFFALSFGDFYMGTLTENVTDFVDAVCEPMENNIFCLCFLRCHLTSENVSKLMNGYSNCLCIRFHIFEITDCDNFKFTQKKTKTKMLSFETNIDSERRTVVFDKLAAAISESGFKESLEKIHVWEDEGDSIATMKASLEKVGLDHIIVFDNSLGWGNLESYLGVTYNDPHPEEHKDLNEDEDEDDDDDE